MAIVRDKHGRFMKGSIASPGRPKGSRNALCKAFIDDFYADWSEHGADAMRTLRETDISAYVRAAVQLVPKDIDVTHQGSVSVREVKVAFMDKLIDTHDISDDVDQDDEHVTH